MHIAILFLGNIRRAKGTPERVFQIAKELSAQGCQVTLGSIRYWLEAPENENLEVITMSHGNVTIIHIITWLTRLLAKGLTRKYDVVQLEMGARASTLALFLLLHPFGRKFVVVFHEKQFKEHDPRRSFTGRLHLVLQRILLTLFDASITPGLTVKQFFEELYGSLVKEKMFVIPNGIPEFSIIKNIDHLEVRNKYRLDPNAFLALFFGAMTYKPNYETALYLHKVSNSISNKFEKITGKKLIFVIAGIDSEKLHTTKCFIPIGFVEELKELLSLPDAIVLPHGPSYSGPHVKTMYAFLSGKPVIATEDAIKDINVTYQKHFLLIDITKPQTLLEALLDVYFDEALAKNLALNAYIYSQKFTWRYISSLHLKLYRKLLS